MKSKKQSRTPGANRADAKALRRFRLGLTQLHVSDQKFVFSHLTPELRAALWRDRIKEALERKLTKEQRAVLTEIDAHLLPDAYDVANRMARKKFVGFYRLFNARIRQAFGERNRQFAEIVTRLGPKSRARQTIRGWWLTICDCNLRARGTTCDDCWILTNCKSVSCIRWPIGCGCFWLSACDGVCKW
jgi:hypothetical protein